MKNELNNVMVLYCGKCGWHSDFNQGMRNRCPFCRKHVVKYTKSMHPVVTGSRRQLRDVSLSYVSGTPDEVSEFILNNLMENNDD